MPWYVPAIGAAFSWGFYYPIVGVLLKEFSSPFLLVFTHICSCVFFSTFFFPTIQSDTIKLASVGTKHILLIIITALLCIFANYIGFLAISMKNASLAAFLEIAYPVISIGVAFLIFRDLQVNRWSLIGGALVIAGAGIIAIKA